MNISGTALSNTRPPFYTARVDYTENVSKMILLIYFSFILILGVPGNCLIIRVYWSKSHKSSTNILIMSLAFADLTVCMLRLWDIPWYASYFSELVIPIAFQKRFNCVDRTWICTSALMLMLIAVDRYECVCRPKRRLMTSGRSKKAIFAALATASTAHIPLYIQVIMDTRAPAFLLTVDSAIRMAISVVGFAVILLCYTKVFLTIRKHVRVGAISQRSKGSISKRCTRPEASLVIETVSNVVSMRADVVTSSKRISPDRIDKQNGNGLMDEVLSYRTVRKAARLEESIIADRALTTRPCSSAISTVTEATASTWRPRWIPGCRRGRSPAVALQRKTTLMLFVTSLFLLLSWCPHWIDLFFEIVDESSVFLDTLLNLLFLNNAVNPLIYGIANTRFRKDCKEVFRSMRQC